MTDIPTSFLAAAKHIQTLSRRDFIRISTAAAGLTTLGTGLATPGRAAAAGMPDGINHMEQADYVVLHRLMEVMFPVEGSNLVPAQSLPVMQTLDGALLATMPPHVLAGLKAGVAYFNDAPKGVFGDAFVDLSDADAVAFCDALATSEEVPARALITALKFLVGVAYWAIPPTWAPVGFGGPVTEAWDIEFAGNAPLPQA